MEFLKLNLCLFCSSPIPEKVETGKRKRGRKSKVQLVNELVNSNKRKCSIKFLVKYLLHSRANSYDGVLGDILRLAGAGEGGNDVGGEDCSESSTSSVIQICEGCEIAAGNILELHLELEKLQMRIIDQVKSVREGILRGSGWLGGIGGGEKGNMKDDFNRFSERFCGGDGSFESKRIFDSLKAFQVTVTETSKKSIHVPLVYLEKYGLSENHHSCLLEESATEAEIVKTEPPSPSPDNLIDSNDDDDVDDDYDQDSDLSWDPSLEDVEIKLEFGQETEFAKPVRKNQFKSSRTRKKIHQRIHNKNEPVKCDYDQCPETLPRKEALKTHMIRENGAEVHMDTHAGLDQKNYLCDVCGKSFRSILRRRNHRLIHEEKKFRCYHCPKAFHMWRYLRQHLLSHTGEKSHVCDLCGKGFILTGGLRSHRKNCERLPPNQRVRNKMEKIGKPPPVKRIKPLVPEKCVCDVCGKVFRNRHDCLNHKHIHDEKKFECSYCPKTFSIKKYLVNHIRTHTGEKPYQCDGCGKAFTQGGTLSAHRKKCQVQTDPHEHPYSSDEGDPSNPSNVVLN